MHFPQQGLITRRSRTILALSLAAVMMIGGGTMIGSAPRLVWNASASAPMGLYALVDHNAQHGDLALVRTPPAVRKLAAARGYLPATVPMVKRIAASSGDVVCATRDQISIDAKPVAGRRMRDHLQRPLPAWFGCQKLTSNQVFLLMAQVPDSFDGRYFGPTSRHSIIGKLVPLWTQ